MDFSTKKITITYDACRGVASLSRSGGKRGRNLGASSLISEIENIFWLYATVAKHESSDDESLTKLLYAVTNCGRNSIPIRKLSTLVNESWKKKNIEQRCKDDMIKGGNNWKDYMWPNGFVQKTIRVAVHDPEYIERKNSVMKVMEDFDKWAMKRKNVQTVQTKKSKENKS